MGPFPHRRRRPARLVAAGVTAALLAVQMAVAAPARAADPFSVDNPSIGEPGDVGFSNQLVFTVTRDATGSPDTVDYQTVDGTATAGSDYLGTSGSLAFGANELSKQIQVSVLGDNLDEGNETLTLELSQNGQAPLATATGTIVDDADPVPAIRVANTVVREGNAGTISAGFVVSLSNPSGRTVTVGYATADGTAAAPADYTATSGTLTIPAGRLTAVVAVPVAGDTLDEHDENFRLNLSNPSHATLASTGATATIEDDDAPPSLSVDDVTTPDEKNPARFTVSLSAPSGRPVAVDVSVAGGPLPSATPGVDVNQPAPARILFPAGTTSLAVDVPVVDDTIDEPAEHFTLALSNADHAVIADAVGAGTITDDDPGPALAVGDVTGLEGTGLGATFTFPVTLSGADTTKTVTVDYEVRPGTATSPTDYTVASLTGSLTFLPGTTSRSVVVSITGDSLAEATETFTVELRNASAGVNIDRPVATGTIQNDDGPPANVSVGDVSMGEGAGSGHFTVTLERAVPDVVSVSYRLRDGTAAAGADYGGTAAGLVTFAPNTTGPKTIGFTINQDTVHEADETFTVELSNPVNAVISRGTGTATIQDDDAPPVVSIQPSVSVVEGHSGSTKGRVDVTLSAASGLPAQVAFASAAVTAAAGDYTVDPDATLVFAPGETVKQIQFSAVGETLFEEDETFTVTLSAPSGATLGGAVATVTITNDDAAPVVYVENLPAPVVEPATTGSKAPATFTVRLNGPSGKAVTVKYVTADGTAEAGADYDAVTSGANKTVTIAPGHTVGGAVVRVRADAVANEPDETFAVTISNPQSATIDPDGATATGSIKDNTPGSTPRLSIIPTVTVTEGSAGPAPVALTVTLLPAQPDLVTVDWATANGTATAPGDYTAIGRTTLTFAAGETAKSISVSAVGDTVDEADETFSVALVSDGTSPGPGGSAQVTAGQGTATVTIRDDDGPVIGVADLSAAEGDSGTRPAGFTVSLSGPSPQAVTVAYGTSDGTASAPSDYTSVSGTLTFNPGETSKTVNVDITGDTRDEPDEDFTVALSDPDNATIGRAGARVVIVDDDQPTVTVLAQVPAPGPAPAVLEGDDGLRPLTFTLRLNAATTRESSLDYSTADGTGRGGADYLPASGRLSFAPGEVSKTVVVQVMGDVRYETDETFALRLSNPDNVTVTGEGTATIIDDDEPGYSLVASDGGLFAFGSAGFYGSTGDIRLNQPIVGSAITPSGRGYWLVASDGGIFAFGDARFFGSTGAMTLARPIVGMAASPSGNGYWLVASDGGIFAFGDAGFAGSTGAIRLAKPIVGMTASPSGNGYWLVASDGGIFAFGDAGFAGSTGAIKLNQPIVGMAASPSGKGYWLVASDGGIFAFGDAGFLGSTGNIKLNKPVIGIAAV